MALTILLLTLFTIVISPCLCLAQDSTYEDILDPCFNYPCPHGSVCKVNYILPPGGSDFLPATPHCVETLDTPSSQTDYLDPCFDFPCPIGSECKVHYFSRPGDLDCSWRRPAAAYCSATTTTTTTTTAAPSTQPPEDLCKSRKCPKGQVCQVVRPICRICTKPPAVFSTCRNISSTPTTTATTPASELTTTATTPASEPTTASEPTYTYSNVEIA